MERIVSYSVLVNYILNYFPETKWWNGYDGHEYFLANKAYKHRSGLPNEIRIEFDSDDRNKNWENINETAINLQNSRISFAVYYVEGGRSPHIHIYDLDELENLDIDKRKKYRELFLRKICPKDSDPDMALCDEKHLCALEFATHFKHKKPKELLFFFWNGANLTAVDYDLKLRISGEKQEKPVVRKKATKLGEKLKENVRQTVIENLDFETVFDKYGVSYKGKMAICPFHLDTDGSLSFSNEKGLWKCFGCQAKGDIITIIKMLKERENGNKN